MTTVVYWPFSTTTWLSRYQNVSLKLGTMEMVMTLTELSPLINHLVKG